MIQSKLKNFVICLIRVKKSNLDFNNQFGPHAIRIVIKLYNMLQEIHSL